MSIEIIPDRTGVTPADVTREQQVNNFLRIAENPHGDAYWWVWAARGWGLGERVLAEVMSYVTPGDGTERPLEQLEIRTMVAELKRDIPEVVLTVVFLMQPEVSAILSEEDRKNQRVRKERLVSRSAGFLDGY